MSAHAAPRRFAIPTGVSRWVRPLLIAAFAVATIALLALYVFPTRTWLDQRASLRDTRVQLDELQAEKDDLEARVKELDTDEEIELIARSQFGRVMPGEEPYSVLPAPVEPVTLPEIWPFGQILGAPDAAPLAD